jgi:hypothetical protein
MQAVAAHADSVPYNKNSQASKVGQIENEAVDTIQNLLTHVEQNCTTSSEY